MYDGKATNANPTSSYPPCHASMAWGPTICICEMSVWCWEALGLAATWMDTCGGYLSIDTKSKKNPQADYGEKKSAIKLITLRESQNAAQRTSHWLSRCQNVLTKRPF